MIAARTPLAIAACAAMLVGTLPTSSSTQAPTPSIVGVWTLNKDASDKPPGTEEGGERGGRGGGGRGSSGGGRGGGGRAGGGFGRGGGGAARGAGRGSPGEMQRLRYAIRDILDAPERMTITQTGSMVIITTGDGRTTRLSTDGTKVKDESTGIERKTRWDTGRLITEITGGGQTKIIETYSRGVDAPRLTVTYES